MANTNHPERDQAELGEVMNNLQRGFDSASHLDMLLIQGESGSNDVDAQALIQDIKGCFSRAITTLNSSTQASNYNGFLNPLDLPYPTPHMSNPVQSNRRTRNRQRDELGTGTSQEMLFLENPDDCYAWRINEQREVQNSAYPNPRIYYECAYKDELNCCATKTVRRVEEHPSMYEVVYSAQHTCMQLHGPVN